MPNPKWNYQSKDAEILEKWRTEYKEMSRWSDEQRQYTTDSIDGSHLHAGNKATEIFFTYHSDLLPPTELPTQETRARKLASAKKILAALDKDQVKDYQLPDENTVKRKQNLQELLAQAHVDSLFSVDVPTEDQLWRYVPEGIEIFQESDEHLMPFLEEEDKARLIDVYRNVDPMTLDRDGRPALLPEGKAVLNELTGKAVDRMIDDDLRSLMQKMRSVPGLADEELVESYGKFARVGMLVDSLLAHEEDGRVNYLSDEQYMQLIAFRRCKDAVDARVELMLSADYPNIDVETLCDRNKEAPELTVESWIFQKDAPVALRAMGMYLKARKSYVNQVPDPAEAQDGEEVFPNGKTESDYDGLQKSGEQVPGNSRFIVTNSLTPREANIRLEAYRRNLVTNTPWQTAATYEELLKKGLPGFRRITDPREKQERKALREKALERLTVSFQRKNPYLYGQPANGGNRLLMQTLGVLDEDDYRRAVEYRRLPTEQQTTEELHDLYKKGVDKLIENKDLLLQLPQENSDQFLKDFAEIPHLLLYASACDDLVKELRKNSTLTPQQVKDINEIEDAAVATLQRFSQMIYPQSDLFVFKDPAEMTNQEVLQTHSFLSSDPALEEGDHLRFDLTMMNDIVTKEFLIVTAKMRESITAALDADGIRKTQGGVLNFAAPDGKNLNEESAMLALTKGEMVYAYYKDRVTNKGMEVIPLFCPGEDGKGPMLAGDAALAAGRTAYQNRPEPVSPVPEMTAQEDPEPDIGIFAQAWDGIVYFFTSLFGEGVHSDTYQAYDQAWDAWNKRDMQRKVWNRKDEEQQEAAQDAYDVELTGHTCVRNGEIPPAVYKKADVEPPAPRQNRPLPMNFEAKKQELAVKMLDDIAKNEETRYRVSAELFKQLIEDPNIKSKEKDLLISAIAAQQHKIDKAEKAGQQPQPENVQPAKDPKGFVKSICFQAFPKTLGLPNDAAKVQALNKWLQGGALAKTDLGKEYARQLQQQAGNNAQQLNN